MRKSIYAIAIVLFSINSSVAQQVKKMTLAECVEYAMKNNISIKQSELDTRLAAIEKKDAWGNFLPSVNANANHSWNIGLNQNITTGLLENQTTQFTSAGLNAGIDIYKGLQNQNLMRRSKLSILSAQYQLDKMKDDIALNVANAYLQIKFNQENLKVQQEQLSNNQRQMQRTDELVQAGSVPRGDLLDMQATVATSKKAVVDAENALLISKLSLAQLLQLEDFRSFDIADEDYSITDSPVLNETPEAILEKARQERNELKIAKANLEIAEKDIQIARGGFQPSLQGYYSFSSRVSYSDRVLGVDGNGDPILAGPAPFFDQFSDNKGHNFGLQLNIPILNGFSVKNNVARNKVAYERSKIAMSQAELDLERNVFQAFTDVKGALNAYESALVAAEARELSFNYAKEKYDVGIMNSFDYNQAQSLYVNAQSEVVRAKFDYIFRVKVLEYYFGIPINKLQ